MIRKTTMALVATLVFGSATAALASAGDNDPNTGLWTYLYYGPIADLAKQGLPVKPEAMKYLREHGSAQAAVPTRQRAPVMLLEDRELQANPYDAPHANTFEYNWYDKQSGHNW